MSLDHRVQFWLGFDPRYHQNIVSSMLFHNDCLYTASRDSTIRCWKQKGQPVCIYFQLQSSEMFFGLYFFENINIKSSSSQRH